MTDKAWNSKASIEQLKQMICPGLIGFYNQVEATEILAFPPNERQPTNLLTLLVAEERSPPATNKPAFINDKRIQIRGLHGWRFGVWRYFLPLSRLMPAFEKLSDRGIWDASGTEQRHNALIARPPQFVPPNSFKEVPLNRILKNNFWNGCQVLEWADPKKEAVDFLLSAPHHLQSLSEAIAHCIPMHLASVSDRLGNIILQLPVTVLMARFLGKQDGNFILETGWHPHALQRPLRASIELEFDDLLTGYRATPVEGEQTVLEVPPGPGSHRGILWDEVNSIVLAATGPSAFFRGFEMNMRPIAPEPRIFQLPDERGLPKRQRIAVYHTVKNLVGARETDGNEGWTERRIYQNETSQLVRERRFVQYLPQAGMQNAEHEKALDDIRNLIGLYGDDGAWLWDPYLSAMDILKILFFSPHIGSDLRGLTAKREPPCQDEPGSFDFAQKQRDVFADAKSNLYGLRLEFRARSGPAGWDFHDRFLIFPRKGRGALAWSLGTSINSIGKAHHILQRVDDGQLVMDAFNALWSALDRPEQLVWKVPAA
ncbi:hypothetical protein A6U85_31870 [Agrobacterium sp. 13-626]|nr:hypothetical protein A6U85_31870 [Agrobacterium sp. 13-626]